VAFSCVLSCDFVHPLFLFHTLLISLPLSPVATSPTKQRRTSSTHTQINNLIHTWCQVCLYAKAMCCAYPHISGRMQWWTGDRTCYYPGRRSRRLENQPSPRHLRHGAARARAAWRRRLPVYGLVFCRHLASRPKKQEGLLGMRDLGKGVLTSPIHLSFSVLTSFISHAGTLLAKRLR
jgi:hypothetical protein